MEKWNEEESNENKINLMITWKEEKKKVVVREVWKNLVCASNVYSTV